MSYHHFKGVEGDEYGSFEVFEADEATCDTWAENFDEDDDVEFEPGWYWWACFPGCLPDSDFPNGPFASEELAIADALEIGE